MKAHGDSRAEVPIGSQPSLAPAKGLVHAISEIQFISRSEKYIGDLDPEVMVPLKVSMSFWYEGFYATALPMIFSFFTIPVMMGTLKHNFPAFGSYDLSMLDKILVLFLSVSPGLLKSIFVAFFITRFYLGKVTKTLLNYFVLSSMVPTAIIFSVLGFFFYQVIYLFLLTQENILAVSQELYQVFGKSFVVYNATYKILSGLKESIPKGSLIYLLYGPAEALIFFAAYWYAEAKTKKIKETFEKWNLRKEF